MFFFALLPVIYQAVHCTAQSFHGNAATNASLNFHVAVEGNENFFYRDEVTSGQLLLTSANNTDNIPRLVAALPAGNNGALVYFLPVGDNATHPSTKKQLSISLVNGTLKSTTDAFSNTGIQADLIFTGNATLGVTIVGAVRALRDYVEGSGTMHEIFNYTLAAHNSTFVRLHRQYINSTSSTALLNQPEHSTVPQKTSFKSVDLYFSIPKGSSARLAVTPGGNDTFSSPIINILVPPSREHDLSSRPQASSVRVRLLTNDTTLAGLDMQGLFLNETEGSTPAIRQALKGLADGTNEAAQQVSFLTFKDRFVAGGWRFLTYFGRDSLIALRLLMPVLSSEAIEAALGAVIERANTTGALCHEETVGDYASFINIGNNRSDLGNAPFYDYKMIDTDLLLFPAVSHYFLDLPQGKNRAAQFLAKKATLRNGSYGEILNIIANYNLARALPFYQNSSFANLLAFRTGIPVGNWRDSNEGTGYGTIPFDVNAALVPANLRAIEALNQANLIPSPSAAENNSSTLDVGEVASVWEREAPPLFEVTVGADEAESRVVDFVDRVGLSGVLDNNSTNMTAGNVSFYGLSLKTDGSPVEVMNSDLGFSLLYGTNVSAVFLERVVDALTPYPRGLLTNIGMVVANPAYDSNRTNVKVLDRSAYHGTVIWSFQQGLMAGGIAKQLGFCSVNNTASVDINPPPAIKPSWCSDNDLVQRLRDAQTRLWTSINGASEKLDSEVWSYSYNNATKQFSVTDLASLSPVGTESDAIQLWSFGFLGLVDPTGQAAGSL